MSERNGFTFAAMEAAYAEHGAALVMFDGDGNGPFSADPADYFWAQPETSIAGELCVTTPVSYRPLCQQEGR